MEVTSVSIALFYGMNCCVGIVVNNAWNSEQRRTAERNNGLCAIMERVVV